MKSESEELIPQALIFVRTLLIIAIQASRSLLLSEQYMFLIAVYFSLTDMTNESLSVGSGFRVVTNKNVFGRAQISRGAGEIRGVMHVERSRVSTGGWNLKRLIRSIVA